MACRDGVSGGVTALASPIELLSVYREDNDNPVFASLRDVLRKAIAGGG